MKINQNTSFSISIKWSKPLLVFSLFFLSFAGLQCKSTNEPEVLLRASIIFNEEHNWYKAFMYFGEILQERSQGRIKLEVYPSEQLAKEMESLRMIQAEVIEMTISGSLLSNWVDIAAFCELPYLIQNYEEQEKLIKGPIGKRIEKEIIEGTGLRPITYFVRGPRQLTSNRPIRHPDDLNGLILRVPSVPSFVTAWSAMGAKPTPMALSEVFTSLQQGTIEGLENPYSLILSAGFPEVQKYVNETEHVMSWGYPLIGEKQFQKMPEDLKVIFLEAAKDMQAYEHKLFLESEASVKEELRKRGMEFITVDKEAFAKKCEKAIYESLSPEMQEVYQEIIESKKQLDD